MLEVGTVVFERFIVGTRSELVKSTHLVYGGAFGIERIAMLAKGLQDLVMIPDVRPLVEEFRAEIDDRLLTLCGQQVRGLIDGIHTLVVIHSQARQLDRKRRQRVNAIARRTRRYLADLGVEDVTGPLVAGLCALATRLIRCNGDVGSIVLRDLASAATEAATRL